MKFAAGTRDSITDKPYFYVSECGQCYVTIPINDAEPYLAYRKREEGSRLPAQFLGAFPDAKSAKAVFDQAALT